MQKKSIQIAYKKLEEGLTDKDFLKRVGISKKTMLELLYNHKTKDRFGTILEDMRANVTCAYILNSFYTLLCEVEESETLDKEFFLEEIMEDLSYFMFPEPERQSEGLNPTQLVYMEILRTFINEVNNEINSESEFNPIEEILLLKREEFSGMGIADEYERFFKFWNEQYISEFMYIGREITPFNTLGHIGGVHFTAVYAARQLRMAGAPVDIALVSAAAAGHDLGKYGCKSSEQSRIPYLHYYYTDQFFKTNQMPIIGHIASNHSTWDLELENLSVEALLLIYADFRVKSRRDEKGNEIVGFYSLKDAYQVILEKLDNVDEKKKQRYSKVYYKLKDFEEYMVSEGVNTELPEKPTRKDKGESWKAVEPKATSLLSIGEAIQKFKYLAIEHNISLMNKFNSETSFGSLIEGGRSEKQWKSVRAYVNVLAEYSTYMTQKQKLMTLHFLYELLMNRESDIRRQSAELMGSIILNFDEEFRKELPEGVHIEEGITGSKELWRRYVRDIVFPDHKVTDQHRRWIGYSLKIMTSSMLKCCTESESRIYMKDFLEYFRDTEIEDSTAFTLLDAMLVIPLEICDKEELEMLISFATRLSLRSPLEIKVGSLRFARYMDSIENKSDMIVQMIDKTKKNVRFEPEAMSEIFLENLKVGTPWVVKAVNIEYLLERVKKEENNPDKVYSENDILHIATHLSNLIKVSERVTVRNSAGVGLVSIIKLLPLDQRNEIVIELTKGLELGEYQFAKYIPEHLGRLALNLHPNELNEFVSELKKLQESASDKVGAVALDTLGVLLKYYPGYKGVFDEGEAQYEGRRDIILGMLLRGLASYSEVVSQEAFWVIGQYLFGGYELPLEEKSILFKAICKKMLTLIVDEKETELAFFNSAASLNHIYRFISEYHLKYGPFKMEEPTKAAFFPGTFDPFSLSHKGIVNEIKKLGFEVFLALDEFSWSKKTQPRMVRKQIINMSVANENNVYIFPDNVPVNIANPQDLDRLRGMFPDKELYLVVGSDVVANASSYKAEPVPGSIHYLNHIVFKRESMVEKIGSPGVYEEIQESGQYDNISANVIELKLPTYLEDISSTRIRENIDYNRDIANLIDPVAQNFIYDNSLYLREPQYKHIIQTKAIKFEKPVNAGSDLLEELSKTMFYNLQKPEAAMEYMKREDVKAVIIRDGTLKDKIVAVVAFHKVDTANLYGEFKDIEIAADIRKNTSGKIVVLGGVFIDTTSTIRELPQLIITEALAHCLKKDYTYALYHPQTFGSSAALNIEIIDTLERQGFYKVNSANDGSVIYAVDMKFPITLFQNMETRIKEPFSRDERILGVMDEAHRKIQKAITAIYPGNLILSFNSGILHHKLVDMITEENQVPSEPMPMSVRKLGEYMCVPFGKILNGLAVPNTVTKTLHAEKIFDTGIRKFDIKEFPFYSPLLNQARTIRSFGRPVILVDDLLHKGYRIQKLDPILKAENINVRKIMVGLLSGRGKDLMTIQGRNVDSAYFIPNLRVWFVEAAMYPFMGGDGVHRDYKAHATILPSINMILPYVAPTFLAKENREAVYDFSMTCLENSRNILKAIEEEYQNIFERKLTLDRLGEAVIEPRYPDKGECIGYDRNIAPSVFVENDIEKLARLKNLI